MNTTVKTPVYHFATLASCCVLLVYRKQEYGIFKRYISFFPRFKFGLTGRGARGGGGGGTPIHYLYGYVPPNGVVILKLLI